MIKKIIIHENERGFVFKEGKFQHMLEPGKYRIYSFLDQTCIKTTIDRVVSINGLDVEILLRDRKFSENIVKVEVEDMCIALHFEDNRFKGVLKSGIYYFWKIYHEHKFQFVDISEPRVDLKKTMMSNVPKELYIKIEIPEGGIGLLFFDGKY